MEGAEGGSVDLLLDKLVSLVASELILTLRVNKLEPIN